MTDLFVLTPVERDQLQAFLVQVARDVLSVADDAGMPDSFRETDPRMKRATEVIETFEMRVNSRLP